METGLQPSVRSLLAANADLTAENTAAGLPQPRAEMKKMIQARRQA